MALDISQITAALEQIYQGQTLDQNTSFLLFSAVMQGELDDAQLAALLVGLKIKGERPSEIAGAAHAMRQNAAEFSRPDYAFADIVGTGGDGHNTINISSAAAIVAASCGVKVAKHGNRSVSSQSGSADLFNAFGYALMSSPAAARNSLDQTNFCFLFAPVYHAGVKYAMPVRTSLKTRTLFNILGPLANPAAPTHSVFGVYSPSLLQTYADAAASLNSEKALIVHGSGLDEIAIHDVTHGIEISEEGQRAVELSPELFGLPRYALSEIAGGDPEQNRQLIADVLAGQGKAAHTAAIAINAAALIQLTGVATTYKDAAELAMNAIQQGKPLNTIEAAAKLSQETV
ncbi:anthranilate phosphoribosyltransferase [Alteromonas oceanisediminis]|uniref:anthranilate phosphoribosyltransferase n=1 Tax=Alteromonas oceanisediminis TaxID=2836180 RepID=UPI001BD9337F|nr:anthranilate phosphoribosyltransferase [Alteromonas oceanisediminis]MBT0588058.1 anthranilate phosphoribosyltransferase [Alteromonas oceanisediminis]